MSSTKTSIALAIPSTARLGGFIAGIGTQAFFAFTVVGLFSFLRYGVADSAQPWLLTDSLLALQFAIPHSIILHPKTRKFLRPWISPEYHGLFFCFCTCISLQLMFAFWQDSPVLIWDFKGVAADLMLVGFYGSWVALLYSISLTGFGYQTGWTQWLHWYRGEKMPRRDFVTRSVYQWLRHPVYLGFLGLIWFTPTMSADRAVLTGIWTVYVGVGSVLKDQRLLFYLGDSYASYMQKVAGYPMMFAGPLARRRTSRTNEDRTVTIQTTPHAGVEQTPARRSA